MNAKLTVRTSSVPFTSQPTKFVEVEVDAADEATVSALTKQLVEVGEQVADQAIARVQERKREAVESALTRMSLMSREYEPEDGPEPEPDSLVRVLVIVDGHQVLHYAEAVHGTETWDMAARLAERAVDEIRDMSGNFLEHVLASPKVTIVENLGFERARD